MTYLDELSKEFDTLRDSVQYQFQKTVVKKSNSRHLAKLRRYIGRVRGEHVPKQKWLAKVFEGRPNRTPWKCKRLPYVSKAKRRPCGFATGGYVDSIEMDIEFPSGVAFVNRID